jgi:cytoskeletal protein RodZ
MIYSPYVIGFVVVFLLILLIGSWYFFTSDDKEDDVISPQITEDIPSASPNDDLDNYDDYNSDTADVQTGSTTQTESTVQTGSTTQTESTVQTGSTTTPNENEITMTDVIPSENFDLVKEKQSQLKTFFVTEFDFLLK